jgi:hypothetical protein
MRTLTRRIAQPPVIRVQVERMLGNLGRRDSGWRGMRP